VRRITKVLVKVFFGIVLVAFLVAVYWWLRRRRRKKDREELVIYSYVPFPSPPPPPPPPPPPLDLSPHMYDLVNMLHNVPEHAECPYGDGNIRETFYEDAIVRCSACGAFHHRSCFDRFGRCGSIRCRADSD
jgi:hypothetical protein